MKTAALRNGNSNRRQIKLFTSILTKKEKKSMEDFEKPITAEVRALVHEIVDRFLDYNPTRTRQEITGSKPTFFVTLWGHICTFEVSSHVNGYGNDSKHEYLTDFAGMDLYAEDSLTQLKSVLERMEEIYTAWYEKENANE